MMTISPFRQRRILAAITLVTALAGAFLGLFHLAGLPAEALALTLSSGVFYGAGWSVWWERSPREGAEVEVEELRHIGRRVVRQARAGAVGMLMSAMVLLKWAPQLSPGQSWEILSVGTVALLLALHLYSRAYPAFNPPAAEPWIESLPAAETPVPEPEPGLERLLIRKQQLQARGYR